MNAHAPDYPRRMEEALARGGHIHNFEDIIEALRSGRMQSLAEGNTWAVTQIQDFPRRRVLDVLYVVGDWPDVLNGYRRLIDLACENDCTLIRAHGRPGWGKLLAEYGWTQAATVFHKELD